MALAITCFYTILLAILKTLLGARVSMLRAKLDVSLSHNDNPQLAERIRQHGNFIENVPMGLILMALVEANGATHIWLHAIGATLLMGRIIHPFGIRVQQSANFPRIAGSILTRVSLIIGIVFLVLKAV